MQIGTRIKIIREFRNLTQKDLGLMCGFDIRHADVRIRQYELNKRVPKNDMLLIIAQKLQVSFHAIRPYFTDDYSSNIDKTLDFIEVLFWLEEFNQTFDLFPFESTTEIDRNYIAQLNRTTYENFIPYVGIVFHNQYFNKDLIDWQNKKNELSVGKITLDEYRDWKFKYPHIDL